MENYDVIIAGGGIAGSMAAIAAARGGARTLLLEEEGYLGGSLTACSTGPMMTFHAGEKQVIRGITDELIQRLKAKDLSVGHIPDSTGYTYTVTPFPAEGMKRELELMVLEADASLLYHASVIATEASEGLLRHVTVSSCGQRLTFSGSVFIDATGDADVLAIAGIPYEQGREVDGKDQPMTMNMHLDGVDTDVVRALMHSDRALFPLLADKPELPDSASRLSISGFQALMAQARADGEISFDRDVVLVFETNRIGEAIVNMSRINGESPTAPWSLSRAETEGRRQAFELLGLLRKRIPGFQHAQMLYTGPRVGIRSSRRLMGIYRLSAEDILAATKFDDGIAASGYPIDVHSADGEQTNGQFLRDGDYYTIPFRCLINDTLPNVLAAGRNISTSFEAHASTLVSPSCGALGHAAGCAAAQMVRAGNPDARVLDVEILRKTLRDQQAVVE